MGAARVVGEMMGLIRAKGAGALIEGAFLDRCLVGFDRPGRLRGSNRAEECATRLNEIATKDLRGPKRADPMPTTAAR